MRLLREEKLEKVLKTKEFSWDFQVKEGGIYGIEITASAKSWWQNFLSLRSFFKDDDLTLKIDEIEFPKRGLKQKRLFDGEVAWNGNNLKGKKKTDLFLIKLNKGTHILKFLADQSPKIEAIRIYQPRTFSREKVRGQLEEKETQIDYFPQDNYPIEDANRRQWLTIILVNLGLKFLKIKASAKPGRSFLFFKRDDTDLKLVINGEIQKNQEPKSHQYWYWCGRTLRGREKVFEKELNLPIATHYIEFWTDRSPEVKSIRIGIGRIGKVKRIPTVDDPKWTGNFRDDSDEILLARLIFGEARNQPQEARIWIAGSVINRVREDAWPDTEVILQSEQYDPFKKEDPNYPRIIDPLKDADSLTIRAWQQCYEIAKDIISGEIENPTIATHFHGAAVSKDWFLKNVVPKGRFLRKIGDCYFYWSPN
jgi:hypothetical protein